MDARHLLLIAGTLVAASVGAAAQSLTIPSEVDIGASGLVQFSYACPAGTACRARCFSNDTLITDRDGVGDVVMTAFRTHGRQNAPNFEIQINLRDKAAQGPTIVHLVGQGACTFDGLVPSGSNGFLGRTRRDRPSR